MIFYSLTHFAHISTLAKAHTHKQPFSYTATIHCQVRYKTHSYSHAGNSAGFKPPHVLFCRSPTSNY